MAEVHGLSTMDTFLMIKKGSTYEKLVDIISYPDMGGEPEQIDITTLTDHMKRSIPGVQEVESLSFESNYTPENYAKLKALDNVASDFAVWFGRNETDKSPDGHDGKFEFSGSMVSYLVGGGVNEARKINSIIMPSTEIKLAAS